MNPSGQRIRPSRLSVVLLLLLVGLPRDGRSGDATPGLPQRSGPFEARTLRRVADPIFVRGEQVPSLAGLGLAGFRLQASIAGTWRPIPFQIDEVDGDGLYVLPEGREPNRDRGGWRTPKQLDGALDANDELVFLAADLGDRAPASYWPGAAARGVEIEVEDAGRRQRGWAYLLWYEDPPPLSQRDDVRYAREEDRIHARNYVVGYAPDQDLVYTTHVSVTPAGGGNGQDLVDRINIRFSATVLLRSITFARNEDDFVSRVIAYKDGPIRVMRRVANSMRLVMGLRTPKIIAYSVYYADAVETPNELHLPVALSTVAREAYFEGGTDYLHTAYGARFRSSNDGGAVLVDGRMSPEEKALDFGEHRWTLVSGEQGNILSRLELGPGLRDVLGKRLIYRDDIGVPNAPEGEPGSSPKVGFSFENLLALRKGTYHYNARFYFLPDDRPETIADYLDILDRPLAVRIRDVGVAP